MPTIDPGISSASLAAAPPAGKPNDWKKTASVPDAKTRPEGIRHGHQRSRLSPLEAERSLTPDASSFGSIAGGLKALEPAISYPRRSRDAW